MFYRKDVLEELGLDTPDTWKELIEMLPTIQGNNMSIAIPTAAGSSATATATTAVASNAPDLSMYFSLLYQYGGDMYNEAGTETVVDSEAGVKAFDDYVRYFNDYGIPTIYDFVSRFRSGEMPKVYTAHSEYDEAEFIAKQIRRAQEEGTNYRDIAVLYRIHTLSRNLEEKLRLYGIPYRVYGGMSFYERREIKDILAYLTLIENPAADIALMRVINTPKRGIGAATVGLLRELADRNNCSMMEVLADSDVLLAGQSCKKKLDRFYDLMCELSADWEDRSVQEIIEDVCAKTDYYGMLAAEFPEDAQDRTENIGELMNSACEFEAGA